VIDGVADDAFKTFPKIDSEVTPEAIKALEKVVKQTKTLHKLRSAAKWGRLFGGAGAIIVIDGVKNLMEPLVVDEVQPGSYRGLIPLDRWSGIIPGPVISNDINDLGNFGRPEYYNCIMDTGNVNIHHSRVIRFQGRELPWWEVQVELYWGMSEVEIIFDELKKRDYSSWNIVSLLSRAQVLAVTEPQLATLMSGAGGTNKQYNNFLERMQSISNLLNNQGLLVLGKDGSVQQTSYGFGGIADTYHEFMKDLAAATDEPYEWLFGREGGLGANGRTSLQQHYDHVEQIRTSQYDVVIDQLLPILAMSTWGQVPDDLDHHWEPIYTMTEQERASLAATTTQTIVMAYQADLITKQQAVKELKQHSDESGVFSNITDEDVENTPPTFASEAGMGELDVPQDEEDNKASAEKEDPQHESRESNPKDKSKKESKKKTKE
jgi:phage-related protein (TIGR01555 family)